MLDPVKEVIIFFPWLERTKEGTLKTMSQKSQSGDQAIFHIKCEHIACGGGAQQAPRFMLLAIGEQKQTDLLAVYNININIIIDINVG